MLASPMSQNSMPRSERSLATARMKDTTALQPADTMTPVSSRRVGVRLPSPCASPNTSAVAASAPPKADRSSSAPVRPASMASSAPTDAPPEMPST